MKQWYRVSGLSFRSVICQAPRQLHFKSTPCSFETWGDYVKLLTPTWIQVQGLKQRTGTRNTIEYLIRLSHNRPISTMGFPILIRWHLYIEPGPRIVMGVWGRNLPSNGSRKPHCGKTKLNPVSPKLSLRMNMRLSKFSFGAALYLIVLPSPGHQQPWYWLYRICRSWSYLRKDFKYLFHINVE